MSARRSFVDCGIVVERLWWYFGARSFPPLTESSIQRVDISYGASIRPIEKLAIDLCHQGLLGPNVRFTTQNEAQQRLSLLSGASLLQ